MTAQVIATPPGSTTNYESGAEIAAQNGVQYQIADVDANGNVGPILDPASLNIEVVGNDLQVTLPDGTVLNFAGIVQLWSEGGVAELVGPNGEVVIGSLEQAVAPAAGQDGGIPPDAGSSGAFNQFVPIDPRLFGLGPRGLVIDLNRDGPEFEQDPNLFLLVGEDGVVELVENPGRLFTPEDNRADFRTDTPAIIRDPKPFNPYDDFHDPCDTKHTWIYIHGATLTGNKAFANDGGFGNYPDDLNVLDAREGNDEVWLADKGGVNDFGKLYFGNPFIQLPFFGGADDDKVYGGNQDDIIFGDGLYLGKFTPIEENGFGSGEYAEGYGYGYHGFGPKTGGTLEGGDDYLEGNDGKDYMVGDGLLGTTGSGSGHIGYNLLLPIVIELAEKGGWLPSYLFQFDLKDLAKIAGLVDGFGHSDNIELNLYGGDDEMYGGSGRDTMIGDGIISFCCPDTSHGEGPIVALSFFDFGNEKHFSEQHLKGGDDKMYGGSGRDTMIGDGIFLLPSSFQAKCYHHEDEEENEEVTTESLGFGHGFSWTFGEQKIIAKAKLEGGDDKMFGGSGSDTMIGDGIVAFCCQPSLVTIPVTFKIDFDFPSFLNGFGDGYGSGKESKVVTELKLKGGDDKMFGGSGHDTMIGDGILAICCEPTYVTLPFFGYGIGAQNFGFDITTIYGDVELKSEIRAKGGDDLMFGGSGHDLMIGDGIALLPDPFEHYGHGSGSGPVVDVAFIDGSGSGGWVKIKNESEIRLEGGDDKMFGGSGHDVMAGDGILALCCEEGVQYGRIYGPNVFVKDFRETKLLGGDDLMFGGSGHDVMIGDLIVGFGAQNFYYDYGFAKHSVVMKGGDDLMFGGSGHDVMIGDGIVALPCFDGPVVLQAEGYGYGFGHHDGTVLIGGDDYMHGGSGRDYMMGDGILDLTDDHDTKIYAGDDHMVGGKGGDYMMGDGVYSFDALAFGGGIGVEGFDWTKGFDWGDLELDGLGEMDGDLFNYLAWADQTDGYKTHGGDDVMIGDGLHFNLAHLGHGSEGHDWEVSQSEGYGYGFKYVSIGYDDHMWGNGGDDLMVGDGVTLTDQRRYGGGPAFNSYLNGGILLIAGDDKMFGQDGNDLMIGDGILALGLSSGHGSYNPTVVKGGDDLMVGGDGNDIIIGDGILSIGGQNNHNGEGYGYDTLGFGSGGYGFGHSTDVLVLKGGDDLIIGDSLYSGGSGKDTLIGDGIIAVEFGFGGVPTVSSESLIGGYGFGKVILKGGDDVIFGGSGDDFVLGDGLVGVKVGFGGNQLKLEGGDDVIFGGGSGPDLLVGDGNVLVNVLPFFNDIDSVGVQSYVEGFAYDTAKGGDDRVYGGSGGDIIIGDGLANVFIGGGVVEVSVEGSYYEVANLTGGDDELYGNSGDDFMLGDGFYSLYLGGGLFGLDGLSFDGGDFDWEGLGYFDWKDIYNLLPSPWENKAAWFGIDGLNGGNDTMSGGYGNDFVHGQSGDDTVNGDEGVDKVFGGKGNDLGLFEVDANPCAPAKNYYDGNTDSLGWFGLNGGNDAQQGLDFNPGTGQNDWCDTIEFQLDLGDLSNLALMQELEEYYQWVALQGRDNELFVFDQIPLKAIEWEKVTFTAETCGCDDDTVYNSLIVGTDHKDVLWGSEYNDMMLGFGSADTMTGHLGDDLMMGGSGDDKIFGDYGYNQSYSGSSGDNDKLFGEGGSDKIWGDAGGSILYGGTGGDDQIYGDFCENHTGFGSGDTIWGDAGEDIYYYSQGGNDKIFGGEGHDKIYGDAGDDISYHSSGGDDKIFGGEGGDYIFGDAGHDIRLYSSGGDDQIYGDGGSDNIYGDAGGEISYSSAGGDDVIYGGSGNDHIWGDAPTLSGTGGDDIINGGVGNDVIYLNGTSGTNNGGNDTVIISNVADGVDTINGFDNFNDVSTGHDVIDLDELFDNLESILGPLNEADRIARVDVSQDGADSNLSIDTSVAGDGTGLVQIADITNTNAGFFDIGNGAGDDILVGA